MNPKPTSYVLAALGFLPVFAFAVTPILTGVLGTVQQGLTVTITGTSMVQEDQSSWVSFFQNHPEASGFEGVGTLSSMGYDTAHDADWIYDTSIKLMGTKSIRNYSSGEVIHLPPNNPEHGAEYNVIGATNLGVSSITTDLWIRLYIRFQVGSNGEWPWGYGGGSAGDKLFGKWPGSGAGNGGFWLMPGINNGPFPNPGTGFRLTVNALDGSTVNHDGGSFVWQQNRWYCVELKAPLDSNNHLWEVYLDGALVYSVNAAGGISFGSGDQWVGYNINWYSTSPAFEMYRWNDGIGLKANSRIRPSSMV